MTTSRSYTTAGDLEVVTNGAGRTVAYSYDGQYGRLERISDSLGNSLRYQYDAQGNRIEKGAYGTGGSRQQYTRYDYQHPQWPGKLYQTIYPGGVDVTYNYDAMGNRTEMIDELGRLTRYTFDQRNRLTEVEDPGPVTTAYRYDKQNHLINVTDGKGNETVYTVDDMGRITQVASPDTNTTRYEYDEAGNLVAKTDAKNITTTYQYDTLNRLTHIVYPDLAENVTLVYDEGTYGMGRLTSVTDSSGSTAYTYNQLGQVIQEVRVIDGVSYATSYTYDGAGQIETMTYPSGRVIVYQKDSAGRITGTTVDGQSITGDVRYLPFGPVAGMTFGSGMVNIDRQFDERYLLRQNTAGSVMDHVYCGGPHR